ncbi:hypothetical protein CKA32_000608 [Geitlerinema sp. FC II]|nr:hypothetical protein CKA32_000608 [Geitlerinema sp. FC II]
MGELSHYLFEVRIAKLMQVPSFASIDRQRFDRAVEALLKPKNPYAYSLFSAIRRYLYQFNLYDRCDEIDILIEAYSRGVKKIHRGEEIFNPKAWIRTTAFNIVREKSRDLQRLSRVSYSELTEQDSLTRDPKQYGLDSLVAEEEIQADLRAVIAAYRQLSRTDRQLIDWHIVQKLSWAEVRDRWFQLEGTCLTLEALRKRGSRAVLRLGQLYDRLRSC